MAFQLIPGARALSPKLLLQFCRYGLTSGHPRKEGNWRDIWAPHPRADLKAQIKDRQEPSRNRTEGMGGSGPKQIGRI